MIFLGISTFATILDPRECNFTGVSYCKSDSLTTEVVTCSVPGCIGKTVLKTPGNTSCCSKLLQETNLTVCNFYASVSTLK